MKIALPYLFVTIIAWVFAMGVPYNEYGLDENIIVDKKKLFDNRNYIIVLLIILMFACFRHIEAPAVDEWIYRPRINMFKDVAFLDIFDFEYDPLISVMYWIGSRIFSTDQGSLIISSLLTVPFLIGGIRKHSFDFSTGIAFIFITGYIASAFNGIAQCISAAIFIYFYEYVYNRNFKNFLIILVICFLFHKASFLLLFYYFVANVEFGKRKSVILAILYLVIILVVYHYLSVIFPALGIDEYNDVLINGHHGVRALSIIVSVCPLLFALWIKSHIHSFDRVTNSVANMVLYNSVVAVASSIDVYIARFELFTMPFIAIFYARSKMYLDDKNRPILTIMFILYCFVFIYTYSSTYYYLSF